MLCREPKSKLNITQQGKKLKVRTVNKIKEKIAKNFFYAELGGPPLREYKQPMAMYETSPHLGSIKKKTKK